MLIFSWQYLNVLQTHVWTELHVLKLKLEMATPASVFQGILESTVKQKVCFKDITR